MQEDIGTIINKGISTWVRNLNIFIPFLLNSIAEGIISAVFFGLMAVLLFASQIESGMDLEALSPEELISMFGSALMDNVGITVVSLFVFFLLISFIQVFFRAGAIGMAKEASERGDAVFSDMIRYGSKNAFRLFLVTVLMGLLMLVGIVFIVPGALAVDDLSLFLENPESSLETMGLMGIGMVVWTFYALFINLLLSVVPFALVLDDLDPIEALSTGLRFFMDNKLSVFFLWGISMSLSMVLGLAQQYLGAESLLFSFLTSIISLFVILPLTTVWWTRFYLDRTGKKLYDHFELLNDSHDFIKSY